MLLSKNFYLLINVLFSFITINAMEEKRVSDFLQQLNYGFQYNNPGEIAGSLDKLIDKIPQWMRDRNQKEAFYHSLAHTLIRFTNNFVKSDTPAGSGFTDSFIQTKDESKKSYILEFKIEEKKTRESQVSENIKALKQIFNRDYYKEHQQDDIPMTLAAISFYKDKEQKKINDQFKNLTCSALLLKIREKSLIGHVFKDVGATGNWSVGDELVRHSRCEEVIDQDSWKDLHINKSLVDQKHDFIKNIEFYNINLQKIRKSIELNNIPLFMKNMECILHSIPCHLRCETKTYYQAILYTTLICAGLDVDVLNDEETKDCITIEFQDKKIKIYCFFSKNGDASNEDYILPRDLQKYICEKFDNEKTEKNTTVIGLSITKPTKKSKIEVSGKTIFIDKFGSITILKENGDIESVNPRSLKQKLYGLAIPISPFTPKNKSVQKIDLDKKESNAKKDLSFKFEKDVAIQKDSANLNRKRKISESHHEMSIKKSKKSNIISQN